MTPEIIAKCLEYGVLGVMVVVFGAVIRVLWNRNEALHRELMDLQNLRLADSKAVVTALTTNTATLETHREALNDQRSAFTTLSGEIARLTPRR